MPRNHEASLDDVLRSRGPEQFDYFTGQLTAQSLLGDESEAHGLMQSLRYGRAGDQVDAIGPFTPGVDAPYRIDIVSSYASEQTMAKKVLTEASPAMVHIGLDYPKRHENFTGDYRPQDIGNFTTALCARIAYVGEADLAIHHNDGEHTELIFEGSSSDIYDAFNQIDGKIDRRALAGSKPGKLRGIIDSVLEHADSRNDAVLITSDFSDGYNQQTDSYDWQQSFQQLHEELGDRLWAVRLTSPAQQRLPLRPNDSLSPRAVAAVHRDFADLAQQKEAALHRNLQPLKENDPSRLVEVDTFRRNNERHPAQTLSAFMLGQLQQ